MYPKEMTNIVKTFYNNNNYTIREVAEIFNISKSTIHRWINKDEDKEKINKVVNYEMIANIISKIILENPFVTLKNIQTKIHELVNINLSISGIYVYVKRLDISYKKVSKHMYSNMNDLNKKVNDFKKVISKIKLNDIVCLDESFVHTNMCNEYGWSKKGHKIKKYIKSNPKKFSVMMAITNKEIISSQIYNTNLNKEIFYDYLKNNLLPKIKNKYILMDNVSFHRSKEIINLINESQNKPLFIPPYSPDFNPIEGVFHILKHKIRSKNDVITIKNINNTIDEITNNFQKMYKYSFRK